MKMTHALTVFALFVSYNAFAADPAVTAAEPAPAAVKKADLGEAGFGKASDGHERTPLEAYLVPAADDRAPAGDPTQLSPKAEHELEKAGEHIDHTKFY